jgi:hypothetical protein
LLAATAAAAAAFPLCVRSIFSREAAPNTFRTATPVPHTDRQRAASTLKVDNSWYQV